MLHVLLDDAPFADVTFVFSDGATLKAHRPILMRRSERFNALFSGVMVESRDGNISVVSAERSTFKALLEYLYTDDIRMDVREDSQLVMSLFLLAHEYAFVRLLRLCEGILIRFLQVENCAEFLDYAEMSALCFVLLLSSLFVPLLFVFTCCHSQQKKAKGIVCSMYMYV